MPTKQERILQTLQQYITGGILSWGIFIPLSHTQAQKMTWGSLIHHPKNLMMGKVLSVPPQKNF